MLNVFSQTPLPLFSSLMKHLFKSFARFFFNQLLVFLLSFMSAGYIQDPSLFVKYMHSDDIFLACGLHL